MKASLILTLTFFTAHVPTDVLSLSHFAAASKDAPKPPSLTRQAPPGSKVAFSLNPNFCHVPNFI